MNELLKLAQEHIDLAKKHLQDYIDYPSDAVKGIVVAHIDQADYYLDSFYEEQQK